MMIWPTDYLNKVICGDCLDVLAEIPNASIDSIVTDPPYGLAFMGKRWDYDVPTVALWAEVLRVLKPGGHLLSFSGTRTYHRMAVNIEGAGFEIRDMIAWVYGSGFPKSLDVSKAIDKMAGVEFTAKPATGCGFMKPDSNDWHVTKNQLTKTGESTDEAKRWQGWGTALKPALEPVCVARKPLAGTVSATVQAYGTGALNIDGCRVQMASPTDAEEYRYNCEGGYKRQKNWHLNDINRGTLAGGWKKPEGDPPVVSGRWPANLIHDGSEEVMGLFPETTNGEIKPYTERPQNPSSFSFTGREKPAFNYNDPGSVARFFYCAKASKEDRDEGCEGMEERRSIGGMKATGLCRKCGRQKVNTSGECECAEPDFGPIDRRRTNHHPTVKPTALMRYLCRLVTPPGGIVLDPFFGSGSTGKAAKLEYFNFIGIEREAEYCEIARKRIDGTLVNRKLNFQEARP